MVKVVSNINKGYSEDLLRREFEGIIPLLPKGLSWALAQLIDGYVKGRKNILKIAYDLLVSYMWDMDDVPQELVNFLSLLRLAVKASL